MYFPYLKHIKIIQLFGFMNNFSPQVLLAGLSEMSEVHEEVKLLLAVVHKQAQEHLSEMDPYKIIVNRVWI